MVFSWFFKHYASVNSSCAHPVDVDVDDFVGKDQQFVTDWLVRQGLDKIVEVFKGSFPRFQAFSPCLPSYNLRNHCLYTEARSGNSR